MCVALGSAKRGRNSFIVEADCHIVYICVFRPANAQIKRNKRGELELHVRWNVLLISYLILSESQSKSMISMDLWYVVAKAIDYDNFFCFCL